MKSKHAILFLLTGLVLGCSKGGVVETKYGNGRLSERFTMEKDSSGREMEVRHETWYENGQKKRYEEFSNAKRNGLSVAWHENGQTMDSTNFTDGIEKDGTKMGWHKNGQKKYEYEVRNGEAGWKRSEWYESGKVLQEVEYKNGQPTGRINEWFESGKKMGEYTITNLREVENIDAPASFTYSAWYESGKKRREWTHEGLTANDPTRQFDKWIEWDESGKVTTEETYKNGVKIK